MNSRQRVGCSNLMDCKDASASSLKKMKNCLDFAFQLESKLQGEDKKIVQLGLKHSVGEAQVASWH